MKAVVTEDSLDDWYGQTIGIHKDEYKYKKKKWAKDKGQIVYIDKEPKVY